MTMTLREKPLNLLRYFLERHNLLISPAEKARRTAEIDKRNSMFLEVSMETLEEFVRQFFARGIDVLTKEEERRLEHANPKLLTFLHQNSPQRAKAATEDEYYKGGLLAVRLLAMQAQKQGYELPPAENMQRQMVSAVAIEPVSQVLSDFLGGVEHYNGIDARLGAATAIAVYRVQRMRNLLYAEEIAHSPSTRLP